MTHYFPSSPPSSSVLIIGMCQVVLAARSYLFCRSLAMGSRTPWPEQVGYVFKAILVVGSVACGLGSVVAMCSYPDLFKLGLDNQKSLIGKKA